MTPEIKSAQTFYEQRSGHFWDPFRPPAGRELDLLRFIPASGGHALDYGFGSGALLVLLARVFDRVTGVEISSAQTARLRARIAQAEPALLERVSLIETPHPRLDSIAGETVDFVSCAAVVEHVFDPYELLDELRRIAKPGSTLLLTTPNLAYLKHRLALFAGHLPQTGTDAPISHWRHEGWDGGHLHYFTRDSLDQLLRSCGWQPQNWSGSGDRWPQLRFLRRKLPQLLSGELIVRARAI